MSISDIINLDFYKYLSKYPTVLAQLSKTKSKSKLVQLDAKFQELSLTKREFITKQQLVTIMSWKLSRGKSRPIMHLITSNTEERVKEISIEAFGAKWPANLKKIQELRGVGPATASAILSCIDESIPFFSDECAQLVLHKSKLKYSESEVLEYVSKMQDMAQERQMNARDFERALFSWLKSQ